jgi:hypothetical protein
MGVGTGRHEAVVLAKEALQQATIKGAQGCGETAPPRRTGISMGVNDRLSSHRIPACPG